jgi:hypothetical protein
VRGQRTKKPGAGSAFAIALHAVLFMASAWADGGTAMSSAAIVASTAMRRGMRICRIATLWHTGAECGMNAPKLTASFAYALVATQGRSPPPRF